MWNVWNYSRARPSDPTLAPEVAGPGPAGPGPAQVCRGQLGPLGPPPLSHELELGCICVCVFVKQQVCVATWNDKKCQNSPLQMTMRVKFHSCYNVRFYKLLSSDMIFAFYLLVTCLFWTWKLFSLNNKTILHITSSRRRFFTLKYHQTCCELLWSCVASWDESG